MRPGSMVGHGYQVRVQFGAALAGVPVAAGAARAVTELRRHFRRLTSVEWRFDGCAGQLSAECALVAASGRYRVAVAGKDLHRVLDRVLDELVADRARRPAAELSEALAGGGPVARLSITSPRRDRSRDEGQHRGGPELGRCAG